MAESVALSFATFVVKSLGGFLIQEANNLDGVTLPVEQLQAQLNRMQCFLVAADARPKGGADEIIIRNCVAEIREASYDAEAAIATFVVKIAFRTIGRSDQFPFVLKREVLEGILIKLLSPSNEERKAIRELNHDELVKKLHQVQTEKKCLVILDDIWKDADWDSLSPGFPHTTEVGSKLLLTTRNEYVAKHVDQQCVLYKLRHLTEKESWELFEKTFFRRNEGFTLNTKMIELGKAMVKHCGGVPLAIVVLGGLLATKYTLEDWEEAKEENFLEIVRIKAFGHQLGWADSAFPSSSSPLTTIHRLAVYYLGDCDANSIESENVILLSGHEMKNHNRNLGFLQTLDLRTSSWGRSLRIPNVLWSKLETLENFDARKCDVRCLSKLTNLRKFSSEVAPKDLVVMLKSPILDNSNRLLQYSSFDIGGDFRTEEEQSLLRQLLGCQHLRRLHLRGSLNRANKLPDQFPSNLTELWLRNTKLEEDPMPTLEKLPNLRTLYLLGGSYIGKEMVCSSAPSNISGGGGGGGG
ncbi:putative disease resistance protein [Camellia lanceoleosa]|uniref:Disease resistance protein n=1 Tax=Camellia lanceoleosa TaxID=1840588 RepID=A0ACC0IS58_9ERIC|nr:putative disease resistance protein [Camellia lanceoleosa]